MIYYGAKYAAIFDVCLNSLNQRTVKYASLAAHATRFAGTSLAARQPFGLGACPYLRKR